MKKKYLGIILILFLFSAFSSFSEELDLCIINGTGFDIYRLYISPSNEYGWGDDYISLDEIEVINNGDSFCFMIENLKNYVEFDIMAVDEIGYEHSWFEVEIIPGNSIVLKYDRSSQNYYILIE